MQFFWTEPFKKDYKRLPADARERANQTLRRFASDSRHPSLHVKKMEGVPDIWEMRVSDNYRMTFQFVQEGVLLRRIGTHNILRQP
jgi:mRNA-degrading endonuclease RelE of RelBE toxin-antitoxin system